MSSRVCAELAKGSDCQPDKGKLQGRGFTNVFWFIYIFIVDGKYCAWAILCNCPYVRSVKVFYTTHTNFEGIVKTAKSIQDHGFCFVNQCMTDPETEYYELQKAATIDGKCFDPESYSQVIDPITVLPETSYCCIADMKNLGEKALRNPNWAYNEAMFLKVAVDGKQYDFTGLLKECKCGDRIDVEQFLSKLFNELGLRCVRMSKQDCEKCYHSLMWKSDSLSWNQRAYEAIQSKVVGIDLTPEKLAEIRKPKVVSSDNFPGLAAKERVDFYEKKIVEDDKRISEAKKVVEEAKQALANAEQDRKNDQAELAQAKEDLRKDAERAEQERLHKEEEERRKEERAKQEEKEHDMLAFFRKHQEECLAFMKTTTAAQPAQATDQPAAATKPVSTGPAEM